MNELRRKRPRQADDDEDVYNWNDTQELSKWRISVDATDDFSRSLPSNRVNQLPGVRPQPPPPSIQRSSRPTPAIEEHSFMNTIRMAV